MRTVLLMAGIAIVALVVGARAGWEHLPTSPNVLDRRGEAYVPPVRRASASLAGNASGQGRQMTIDDIPPIDYGPPMSVWSGLSLTMSQRTSRP